MSFIAPEMFFLLISIPLFVLLYLRLQQRRKRIAEAYNKFGLAQTQGRGLGRRRHVPLIFFLIGLTILIVALARPQAVVNLPKIQGTIILAFDVSGSMAADDLKPTRMEAAKAAARDFIQRQPLTVQIGVIAFSESGFSVQPPTHDEEAILAAIDRLSPTRGTSLGNGILISLNTLFPPEPVPDEIYSDLLLTPTPEPEPVPPGSYNSAAIILLTDGENTADPDPIEAAQAAADRGVRVYTIGLGSPTGTTLHVNGFTVHTQLDEVMLKEISEMTDGVYYLAENAEDLQSIYNDIGAQLIVKAEATEITALFAGAGILILLIGGFLSLIWFSRWP
jgi:Ca-activated chloride channel family protein